MWVGWVRWDGVVWWPFAFGLLWVWPRGTGAWQFTFTRGCKCQWHLKACKCLFRINIMADISSLAIGCSHYKVCNCRRHLQAFKVRIVCKRIYATGPEGRVTYQKQRTSQHVRESRIQEAANEEFKEDFEKDVRSLKVKVKTTFNSCFPIRLIILDHIS